MRGSRSAGEGRAASEGGGGTQGRPGEPGRGAARALACAAGSSRRNFSVSCFQTEERCVTENGLMPGEASELVTSTDASEWGWANSALGRSRARLPAEPSAVNSRAGLREGTPRRRSPARERVAWSVPRPPGAGACPGFRSLRAEWERLRRGPCLRQRDHHAGPSEGRGYCLENQKLLPGKRKKDPRESDSRPHLSPLALCV